MSNSVTASEPLSSLASQVVTQLLSIKPLANLARYQARKMMIQRATTIGVDWIGEAAALAARDWQADFEQVQDPALVYPAYYLRRFHAYDQGNLGWQPATEVEVAAYAVHARIWPDGGPQGDARLRQSYHDCLLQQIEPAPLDILDLGCGVGMSTFALQATYPHAHLTGVDLSPYFLAIAHFRSNHAPQTIQWRHAPAEATGLADASFDLVSSCLVFHELPQQISQQILQEARRLLRPQGYLAIMDMNPRSEVYAKLPPYVLTLLKSTEPYLDDYFGLDLNSAFLQAGFQAPTLICNSPRHRTFIAQAK
jgi:SAM-dependent methyltransferase